MNEQKRRIPPLIEDAGQNGLIVGFFALWFFVLGSFPGLLSLLGFASGVFGMVWLVRQQLKRDRESITLTGRGVPAATLASYGIVVSFFAALPVSLIIYIALKWVWPDFIISCLRDTAEMVSQIPDYKPLADELRNLIEHGPIPAASDIMATVMMTMLLGGLVIGIGGMVIVKIIDRQWKYQ